jgi:hypothetical protein
VHPQTSLCLRRKRFDMQMGKLLDYGMGLA